MRTQPGTRDELMSTSELGTVEDAVQIFIAREQVALNSFLPDEMSKCLRQELFGAMLNGTEYAIEVIQRYHALVTLVKAVARHTGQVESSGWASASASVRLNRAVVMAEGYGWTVTWSKFNTRVERIQ